MNYGRETIALEFRSTRITEEPSSQSLQSLVNEVSLQSSPGPGVEPETAAMFKTLLSHLDQQTPTVPSPLSQLVHEAAWHMERRGIKPGPIVSALRTTLVDYFSQIGISDNHRTTEESWEKPFQQLESEYSQNCSEAIDSLHAGLTFREAATTIPERYYNAELIAQLLGERFPDGIRVLDIGSSIMEGPIVLMNKDEFEPLGFKRVQYGAVAEGSETDLTSKVNSILNRPSRFQSFVCVDPSPVFREVEDFETNKLKNQSTFRNIGQTTLDHYDAGTLRFSRSGKRPSERHDPSRQKFHERAIALKEGARLEGRDSGVTFYRCNFLSPIDVSEFRNKYPEPFDMIILNYVTQELAADEQVRMHKIAYKLLGRNGIMLYNHQAYLPDTARQPSSIHKIQHHGSYATSAWMSHAHVLDRSQPIIGLRQVMDSFDNRWRDIRITPKGKLQVGRSLESIKDLIQSI